jgi:hypothetical protein
VSWTRHSAIDPPCTAGQLTPDSFGGRTVAWTVLALNALRVAVRATVVDISTGFGATLNHLDVAPAGTVIDGGSGNADGFALASAIVTPADPAGPLRITLAHAVFPPVTGEATAKLSSIGGATRRLALRDVQRVAVIVTATPGGMTLGFEFTGEVAIVKLAVRSPPGTVTEAGTVATAVSLLWSDTEAPDDGALRSRVTVPMAVDPPATEDGLTPSDSTETGERKSS